MSVHRIKHLIFVVISLQFLFQGCKDDVKNDEIKKVKTIELNIPDTSINISELDFDKNTSVWSFDDQKYSGYAISFYPKEGPKQTKMGILNGKKQSQDSVWYENGNLKRVAGYNNGKLHGEKKFWLMDSSHVLISHLNYQNGKPHGIQRTWYPTGELHKELDLNFGKEDGMQKAYRKNRALYANYEAKNGRIFGLKKASLCYGLDNQKLTFEK